MLEGNFHFCFTQDFLIQAEVDRYEIFMGGVCEFFVEKYNGSLNVLSVGLVRSSAPHGT